MLASMPAASHYYDRHLELHIDLQEAFATFTRREQRVLIRVLVAGQSVREATCRMRKSTRTWERWMKEEAIPRLQTLLEDYVENRKVVVA